VNAYVWTAIGVNRRYQVPMIVPGAIEAFVPFTTREGVTRNGSVTATVTFTASYTSAGDGDAARFAIAGGVVSRTLNDPCEDRFQFPLVSTASTVNV
jgi:hypothetical protein